MLIFCSFLMISWILSNKNFSQCITSVNHGNITGNVPFGPPINWANPNRVEFTDDLWAHATFDPLDTTKYLWVSDFQFVLPPASIILGIVAHVEHHADSGAYAYDASIKIIQSGTISGTDHLNSFTWPDLDAIISYGSPVDLWGLGWTAADIMDPGFGVVISATRIGGDPNLSTYVDWVGIEVYFDNPGGCILPISLISFSGYPTENNDILLEWMAEDEVNSSHYTIERSPDGQNFSAIGSVPSQHAIQAATYSFTDNQPFEGNSFYRLRQTDLNGNFETFQTIEINKNHEALEIKVWPNPATDLVHLSIEGLSNPYRIRIFTIDKKIAWDMAPPLGIGFQFDLDLSLLESGIYFVEIKQGDQKEIRKLVLQ